MINIDSNTNRSENNREAENERRRKNRDDEELKKARDNQKNINAKSVKLEKLR